MHVVYNSFNGRYADNPRAVHAGLLPARSDMEHTWLVDPRYAGTFPADVATVPIRSRAAVAALEDADVLVANCHVDLDVWDKKPGAVYLQTWHGTPLKRIHRAAVQHPDAGLMAALDTEIARWDRLLTPSPAGTRLLRDAFGYTGEVLETGYPRNDVLSAPDAGRRRAEVRRQLGLADGTTAVLWAPTFRDDDVTGEGGPSPLDADALLERLGGDHVLLVRRHYYLGHRAPLPGHERVRDVSAVPDISGLYLAADALVTDYSSSVFDFAVTGKPIVLYAYDLPHFRDRLRGFAIDLDAEAPGPVVVDQESLGDALADLNALQASWAERYAVFRDRYCRLEDGHATERVLAAVFPAAVVAV